MLSTACGQKIQYDNFAAIETQDGRDIQIIWVAQIPRAYLYIS